MLQGFSGLRSLNLSRNKIRTIAAESFRTQGNLIHLDLSGNELIYINPEAFRGLHSTHFWLDHNPWDCSCRAKDFVLLIQELANASRLEKEMEVVCATPPQLKEELVWNVTKCPLPSPPVPNVGEPPQGTLPTLIGLLVLLCILVCGSCLALVLCRHKWDNKQVEPEADPEVLTENSCLEPGVPPTGAQGMEGLKASEVRGSKLVRARASSAGPVLSTTELPSKNSRTRKEIEPGMSGLTRTEIKETQQGLDANLSEGQKATQHLEVGTVVSEVEGAASVFKGPAEPLSLQYPNLGVMEKSAPMWETRTPVDHITEKNLASEGAENLPYLSIGTEPARQSPEAPEHHHGNKDVFRRVIRRISTWPPTSFQWKEKDTCKSEANHLFPTTVANSEHNYDKRKDADCYKQTDFFLEGCMSGFWENVGRTTPEGNAEEPSGSRFCPVVATNSEKKTTTSRRELFQPPKQTKPVAPDDKRLQAGQGPGLREMGRGRGSGSRPQKLSKDKRKTHSSGGHEEGNTDPQRGSTVLSHNARGSPADKNLLQDNEYAFINLLQEVVQNQGRWTRDRWKQTHLNKQRSKQ
ncbi:uncharacterized protein LOC108920132 [Scleropages formosus]|uniref:uncharacterized protein LOC108920132 n=1 Tax=Scleropages formosus TaxID=113540 RepID=UPI0010FAAFB7|nr:uncharacterized protein LOC108920132 [Scleropages formosus]